MNTRPQSATAGIPTPRATGSGRAGNLWRKLATGFCFVMYGTLGWLSGLIVLPVLLLWPGSAAARQRRIRRFASWSFRWLLSVIAGLRVGDVELEGAEWLAQSEGKLVVANHPMYLDVVALVGWLPQADCVVKQAMWRNHLYRRFVRVIGYIGNASQSGLVGECVERLQRGRTLILFPEGTRSTPDQAPRFCRGAAQVAVRSGCEVLPVVIRCEPLGLGKNQTWHEDSERPWTLHVRVFPPRTLADLDCRDDMPHGVAARHVNRVLEQFYARELGYAEHRTERAAPQAAPVAEVAAGVEPHA